MWTNIVGARPPPPTRSQGRLTPSHKKCLFEPLKGFNKLSDPEGFIMVFPSCWMVISPFKYWGLSNMFFNINDHFRAKHSTRFWIWYMNKSPCSRWHQNITQLICSKFNPLQSIATPSRAKHLKGSSFVLDNINQLHVLNTNWKKNRKSGTRLTLQILTIPTKHQ